MKHLLLICSLALLIGGGLLLLILWYLANIVMM
jgi:hypothetical protein